MNYDKLEANLKSELNALAEEGKLFLTDTEWTLALKNRLVTLGERMGFQVRTSGKKNSEWLYDVVWLVVNTDGTIKDIALVLESEWKQNEEEYDFDKLIIGRSQHRGMVFTGKAREDYSGSIERLKNSNHPF